MDTKTITNIDEASETVTYIGYAEKGTADNEPGWYIIKIEVSGNITKTRKANTDLNAIWDNRASLIYN